VLESQREGERKREREEREERERKRNDCGFQRPLQKKELLQRGDVL
jgi:hypothetical protein